MLQKWEKNYDFIATHYGTKHNNYMGVGIAYPNRYKLEQMHISVPSEIAKKYGGESSPSFINGVLGTILTNKKD